MKKSLWVFLFSLLLVFQSRACAEIKTMDVDYSEGDTALRGYLAYDETINEKVPVVIIVHEWTGLGDYVKKRAQQVASLGYVAFAADIYGKSIRPKNREEAGKEASIYRNDRALMRRRAHAAIEEAKKFEFADTNKIAAIGYCFGGGVVLEMARAGEDLAGVVSFHGSLDSPDAGAAKEIKAKVLVLHGAEDPNIAGDELKSFEKEMRLSRADWQVVLYGGAAHSFSNPDSGNDPSGGSAYNEKADQRSWQAMQAFFKEIF